MSQHKTSQASKCLNHKTSQNIMSQLQKIPTTKGPSCKTSHAAKKLSDYKRSQNIKLPKPTNIPNYKTLRLQNIPNT